MPTHTICCRRCKRLFLADETDDQLVAEAPPAPRVSFVCDDCYEAITANIAAAAEEH